MLKLTPTEEPTYSLDISGKKLSFLIDTGATYSTIAAKELPGVEKSNTEVQVVGLGGSIQTLKTTTQLPVRCGPLQEKHAFLLTTTTPVNLLGRDLLCKLGCKIACTKKGVFVDIPRDKAQSVMMILMTPHPVVYWWRLPRQPISDALICLNAILAESKEMQMWLDNAQVMTHTYYHPPHCTIYYAANGNDVEFAEKIAPHLETCNDVLICRLVIGKGRCCNGGKAHRTPKAID